MTKKINFIILLDNKLTDYSDKIKLIDLSKHVSQTDS